MAIVGPGLRVLAIAVIGKLSNPLFIKNYSSRQGSDNDLKWHYAAHCSLDVFEERESQATKSFESYLGLLYAMEDYVVYGFQTHTRIRFVLVLALADVLVRDADIKAIFNAINNAYIAHTFNPFSVHDGTQIIKSKRFEAAMDAIAGTVQQ